ncbi:serine/threonine-protein kinase [Prochlorothrix hollandica]|uniref:serine/threonine-protein kinase n=1 Tax=Prochlorothrix hollandica TaxID=1223 RepID=UPI00137649D8|nr:serine/threonine-protein kinase [Prochlorothrix hollandica]
MAFCLNPQCQDPANPNQCSDRRQPQPPCLLVPPLLNGRFDLEKFLGQGGFGRTYKGLDTSNKLACVIKQFVPQSQGTWAIQKAQSLFKEEADRLRTLGENPQIPGLIDEFEDRGYLYLVQQYVEGPSLKQDLEKAKRFSERRTRETLESLLGVLQYVHQLGVVHRDIKPDNIMVRQSQVPNLKPFNGQLVLIDFGVSKDLQGSIMALPGTAIGSLGYAPLEQIQQGQADYSCDLYSLAITCVELLTGRNSYELHVKYGYSWVAGWRQRVPGGIQDKTLGAVLDKMLRVQGNYGRGERSQGGAAQALRELRAGTTVVSDRPRVSRRWLLGAAGFGVAALVLPRLVPGGGSPTGGGSGGLGGSGGTQVGEGGTSGGTAGDGGSSGDGGTGSQGTATPESPSQTPQTPPEPSPSQPLGLPVDDFRFTTATVDINGTVQQFEAGPASEYRVNLPGNVPLRLVYLRGGTFTMGSPNGEPRRDSDEGP